MLPAFFTALLSPPGPVQHRQSADRRLHLPRGHAFPLTLPFTTGPGTTAVAIGAEHRARAATPFFAGVVLAAVLLAIVIAAVYAYADRLTQALGRTGSRTVTRLSAFLLFGIGV